MLKIYQRLSLQQKVDLGDAFIIFVAEKHALQTVYKRDGSFCINIYEN